MARKPKPLWTDRWTDGRTDGRTVTPTEVPTGPWTYQRANGRTQLQICSVLMQKYRFSDFDSFCQKWPGNLERYRLIDGPTDTPTDRQTLFLKRCIGASCLLHWKVFFKSISFAISKKTTNYIFLGKNRLLEGHKRQIYKDGKYSFL